MGDPTVPAGKGDVPNKYLEMIFDENVDPILKLNKNYVKYIKEKEGRNPNKEDSTRFFDEYFNVVHKQCYGEEKLLNNIGKCKHKR